jgi:plasmid maintenance system antidote protein VapI
VLGVVAGISGGDEVKKQVTPGTLIKRRLKVMGWSVELLAEELGITVKHCKRMLAGSVDIVGKTGSKIMKLLSIDPGEMMLACLAHPPKSRKAEGTPRGKVKKILRQLFVRSRERAAALKAAGYCCESCGIKQSRKDGAEVTLEVHHIKGISGWEALIDMVYAELLCSPDMLQVLCRGCHSRQHESRSE